MVILVLLKVDGQAGAPSGSASVLCTAIKPDPLFPEKVILEGIEGLSWPISGKFLNVQSWSVDKDAILNWMAGPLQDEPSITLGMLEGETPPTPWPIGTLPNQALMNDQPEIDALVQKLPEPPPEPPEPTEPPEPPTPPAIEVVDPPEVIEPPVVDPPPKPKGAKPKRAPRKKKS